MPKSNRNIVIALIVSFFVPMIFAGLLYTRGKPIGTPTNHGTLINPPIATNTLFKKLPKKWTIVWFTPKHCHNKDCLQLLHDLHQIQKAMGKYQSNTQLAVLTLKSNAADPLLNKILNANKQIATQSISSDEYRHLLKANASRGMIYLRDPSGFVMMRYLQNDDPMKIYKDLSRLIKFNA